MNPSILSTYTSANRPSASGNDGLCIYRTDTNSIEISDGTNWQAITSDGVSYLSIDNTKSIAFDGSDDHVLIPSNSAYGFGTGDFTITFWVNVASYANTYNAIFDFRYSGNSSNPAFFISQNAGYQYYLYMNAFAHNYTSSPNTGQWYMGAVVRNGSNITVYLDGTPVTTGTNTYSVQTPTSGIKVGHHYSSSNNSLHGNIDEFAIWDKALSASQISQIYNNGNQIDLDDLGSSNQPLTWLRMGDGDSGTTIKDHGSLGNDASLVNGASIDNSAP